MIKILFRVFTYSFLFFSVVKVQAQSLPDTAFDDIPVEERLSLLFLTPGDAADKELSVVGAVASDVKGKVVDVSSFFKDSLKLPFPGYDVLKCIPDTSFAKYLYRNTSNYFALKGAAGILFKSSGKRCSGTYVRKFMQASGGGSVTTKSVAVFDGMPLLKSIDKRNDALVGGVSFTEDHYDFKYWIELFSDAEPGARVSFEELLKKGYLFLTDDISESVSKIERAIQHNVLDSALVMKSAKEVYDMRLKVSEDEIVNGKDEIVAEQKRLRWKAWVRSMSVVQKAEVASEQSFMINNASYGILDKAGFFRGKYISRYTSPRFVITEDTLIDSVTNAHQLVVLVSEKDTLDVERLKVLNSKYILKLIYSGSAEYFGEYWLNLTDYFEKILFVPGDIRDVDMLLEQAMFGGIEIKGSIPYYQALHAKGFRPAEYEKIRLGYAFPELTGMSGDTLDKIDAVLKEIVRKKMAPGGQLLIARNGYVVYDKPFGYMTYAKKQKVKEDNLYDLASLTKIIVTIPEVMKLCENKQIDPDKQLKEYLPSTDTTEAGNIVIRDMLLHEAGLPSYIPFHLNYVDENSFSGSMYSGRYSRKYSIRLDRHFFFNSYVRYRKDVFSHKPDTLFNVQLSKGMFMNYHFKDSIYVSLANIKLHKKKGYRYSDLGYYFLQKIIERQTGKSIEELFRQWFAIPLGTERLVFTPLKYFPEEEIVPSGKDMVFRKEMLRGFPNDAGAAMQGGVAGHAGLFGNADDIAKFAQMLLNKGRYGGVRFLESSTVELFTSKQNSHNRRGLGFDKPEFDPEKDTPVSELASETSFGHSGFTGTLLWIDPEYDLIYIFLSNRVYPYSYNKKLIKGNVRTKIQDMIYRSITVK